MDDLSLFLWTFSIFQKNKFSSFTQKLAVRMLLLPPQKNVIEDTDWRPNKQTFLLFSLLKKTRAGENLVDFLGTE